MFCCLRQGHPLVQLSAGLGVVVLHSLGSKAVGPFLQNEADNDDFITHLSIAFWIFMGLLDTKGWIPKPVLSPILVIATVLTLAWFVSSVRPMAQYAEKREQLRKMHRLRFFRVRTRAWINKGSHLSSFSRPYLSLYTDVDPQRA